MKKLTHPLFALIGILIFGVIVYLTQFRGIKRIDVSVLKMEKAILPEKFECSWYSLNNVKWNYKNQYNEEYLYMGMTKTDGKIMHWIDDVNGGVVNAVIVNYEYPIIAKIYYFLQNPKWLYKDSFENFISSKPVNLNNWKWNNKFANEESVQCGLGSQEHCNGWFYRARYAQYFLYIRYQGPDCVESFEGIVKSINEQFIAFLK
jgi:hypothetical protein